MDPKNPIDIKKFMDRYKENPGVDTKEIIIYGMLANQNMSGYDLFKIIEHKAFVMGPMMKASKQSVYNLLKKIEEKGDCEVAEVVSDTNRPNKSLYKLTDQGKERLNDLIRQELSRPPVVFNNVAGTLGIAQSLPREEIRDIVAKKVEELEYMVEVESLYQNMSPGPLLKVLSKSKVEQTKVLLKNMKEALEVIDDKKQKDLFQWPDFKKNELWKQIAEEEG